MTDQQHEQELREGASIGLKHVLAKLADTKGEPTFAENARLGMGLLSKHNGFYSARSKRAEVVIAAVKMVHASGEALAEALQVALPQVPLLAAAASAQVPKLSAGALAPGGSTSSGHQTKKGHGK